MQVERMKQKHQLESKHAELAAALLQKRLLLQKKKIFDEMEPRECLCSR